MSAVATATQERKKEVSADSYDVYSAVLSQHYGSWFEGKKTPILILPHTVLEPQGHSGGGCRAQVEKNKTARKLLDRLLSEKEELRIEEKLRVPGPYKMTAGRERTPEDGGPGVFSLSAVEFSEDRSTAMVLVGRHCGALCGTGYVWILNRTGRSWRMAKDQLNCGWISRADDPAAPEKQQILRYAQDDFTIEIQARG